MYEDILRDTRRHLELVLVALLLSIAIGVPLGVVAARARWLAGPTLAAAGLLQTIPSLALLAFLIPLLGIGVRPPSSRCSSTACCRSCATPTSDSRRCRHRSWNPRPHSGCRAARDCSVSICRWCRP
jgi:osmoprotectant transport system permease protein